MPANTVIKIRRGNSGAWVTAQGVLGSTPVLAAGEFGYETDTNQIKVGDGTSVWGSLPYITGTGIPASTTRAYSDIVVSGVDTVMLERMSSHMTQVLLSLLSQSCTEIILLLSQVLEILYN